MRKMENLMKERERVSRRTFFAQSGLVAGGSAAAVAVGSTVGGRESLAQTDDRARFGPFGLARIEELGEAGTIRVRVTSAESVDQVNPDDQLWARYDALVPASVGMLVLVRWRSATAAAEPLTEIRDGVVADVTPSEVVLDDGRRFAVDEFTRVRTGASPVQRSAAETPLTASVGRPVRISFVDRGDEMPAATVGITLS